MKGALPSALQMSVYIKCKFDPRPLCIYAQPIGTDNSMVKASWGEWGQTRRSQRGGKGGHL